MTRRDWRSYDEIAGTYDRVWGPRFDAAARRLVNRVRLERGWRLLDVGTGTGAIPAAVAEVEDHATLTAVDVSSGMLARARARVPRLLVVVGEASQLPFLEGAFDAVTFGFVLSHVREHARALGEAHRVMECGGRLGVSNWGPITDAAQQVWKDLLLAAVGSEAVERALGEVAPWEGRFEDAGNLRRALAEARFEPVGVDVFGLPVDLTVDEFLDDRELGAGGRYARHTLGEAGWRAFRGKALEVLRGRFGPRVAYERSVLIAVGTKP